MTANGTRLTPLADWWPRVPLPDSGLSLLLKIDAEPHDVSQVEPSTTIALRDVLHPDNLRSLHHDQGLSIRQIAAKLDVSIRTLYRTFANHNISIEEQPVENHKPHLRHVLTKDALTSAIHDDELTVAQIAARHDCSVQTVYTYLKNHDIELPAKAPRTRRHPSLTIENVTVLYASGLSQSELAKHFNVSKRNIAAFMEDNNITARPNKVALNPMHIRVAYQRGATLQQLADRFGCSVWTITQRLEDDNIDRRPAKRRANPTSTDQSH